jgi:hypothetical protein
MNYRVTIFPEDPRRHNKQFNLEAIQAHVEGYTNAVSTALLSLDWCQLNLAMTRSSVGRTFRLQRTCLAGTRALRLGKV